MLTKLNNSTSILTWSTAFLYVQANQETRSQFDRDSGESKRSPHLLLPSSPILTHWCSGLFWNQFFLRTSLVEGLGARALRSTFNLRTANKENNAFHASQGRKMLRMFKDESVRFQEESTKNICSKILVMLQVSTAETPISTILWDEMRVNQNPRKNGSLRSPHQMGRLRKWNYGF